MTTTYCFGDFTLTASTRELRRGADAVAISPRAFDCLAYLIEHRDRAVGKDELVAAIWERVDVSDTQLGQTILRARRAVDDDGQALHVIRTVSRFGYRWVADVEVLDDATTPPGAAAGPIPAATSEPMQNAAIEPAAPVQLERRRRPVFAFAAIAIALVITAAFLSWRAFDGEAPGAPTPHEPTAAVVLPMHVTASDTDAWLRLGVMDLVAQRLRAGGLAVPPSENTVALLQNVPDDDADATQRTIERAVPASLVVAGDIVRDGDRWSVTLRAVAADGTTLTAKATADDALAAARDASDRLLGRLGHAKPPDPPYASGIEQRLQRAQSAMLSNDLDAARAILVGDPELAHAEPELTYRLAMVDFRAGEYARAGAALTSLLGEQAARQPAFRARVLDGRGAVRIRQDDYTGAESDYDAAIALLKDSGNAPELGRALTGRGVSRAMRREFAPALADLGQARVELGEAGDALGIARVDTDQAALEMNRDRPQQAVGYLEKGAQVFERYGAINELMETLESLVSNHLALLEPAAALRASDRSWALTARVTDPNQRLDLIEDRVDAFLSLGRLREAAALLSTLPDDAPDANPFVARRLHALRARLAAARDDNDGAAREALRALALPPPSDDTGEGVAEIARVYQRAVLASGASPAQAPAAKWIDFDKPVFSVQALTAADWAAFRDDVPDAGRRFRHALDLAEARGEPADVGAVTDAFGPWLLAHGRLDEAAAVIGRVAPWADRDYDSALLQVRLYHALGQPAAWRKALDQAQALAGERALPPDLAHAPDAHASIAATGAR